MAGNVRRWLMVTAAGVAAIVLSIAPTHTRETAISDEDDCTMSQPADLNFRCTRG